LIGNKSGCRSLFAATNAATGSGRRADGFHFD